MSMAFSLREDDETVGVFLVVRQVLLVFRFTSSYVPPILEGQVCFSAQGSHAPRL